MPDLWKKILITLSRSSYFISRMEIRQYCNKNDFSPMGVNTHRSLFQLSSWWECVRWNLEKLQSVLNPQDVLHCSQVFHTLDTGFQFQHHQTLLFHTMFHCNSYWDPLWVCWLLPTFFFFLAPHFRWPFLVKITTDWAEIFAQSYLWTCFRSR